MNKIILLLSFMSLSYLPQESSLYQMQFKSLDKDKDDINMSVYKGKKLIIVEFNVDKPNYLQLLSLDTLYQYHKHHIAVLAIPVSDHDIALPRKLLISLLRDSLKLSYPIAEISNEQKKKDTKKHSLLQWLTSKTKNGHFDVDIEADNQLYIVSETGVLYAVLKDKISPRGDMMMDILGQQVKE